MIRRLILTLVAAVLLGGCDAAFLYGQMNWLIPSYIGHYLPLDDDQRERLDVHVERLIGWHCSTQLGDYAAWLRGINADIQAGRLNQDRLRAHGAQLEGYWREVAMQASPGLADILARSSEEQIRDLMENLVDKERDFREDFVDAPLDEVQDRLAERLETRMKRWVGNLTEGQRKLIAAWSLQLAREQSVSLAMREHWRKAVAQALTLRRDPARFTPLVLELASHPERSWTEAQRRQFEARRSHSLRMLEILAASLTDRQRQHFAEKTSAWVRDFTRLACSGGHSQGHARTPAAAGGSG